MTSAIRKATGKYVETEVDGERVVMSLDSGRFFALDGTGLAVWEALDTEGTQAAIVDRLSARYGEPPARIAEDVAPFLARLREAGLIEPGLIEGDG